MEEDAIRDEDPTQDNNPKQEQEQEQEQEREPLRDLERFLHMNQGILPELRPDYHFGVEAKNRVETQRPGNIEANKLYNASSSGAFLPLLYRDKLRYDTPLTTFFNSYNIARLVRDREVSTKLSFSSISGGISGFEKGIHDVKNNNNLLSYHETDVAYTTAANEETPFRGHHSFTYSNDVIGPDVLVARTEELDDSSTSTLSLRPREPSQPSNFDFTLLPRDVFDRLEEERLARDANFATPVSPRRDSPLLPPTGGEIMRGRILSVTMTGFTPLYPSLTRTCLRSRNSYTLARRVPPRRVPDFNARLKLMKQIYGTTRPMFIVKSLEKDSILSQNHQGESGKKMKSNTKNKNGIFNNTDGDIEESPDFCYGYDPWLTRSYNIMKTRSNARGLIGHETFIDRLGLSARLHGHTGCVNSIYIDDDCDLMVSGSDDTHVRFWNSIDGTPKGSPEGGGSYQTGHLHNIFGVKTVPGTGGSQCCTVAADGQVRHIDINAEKDVALDQQDEIALALAFVPMCSPVFLASFGNGTIRMYDPRLPRTETGSIFTMLSDIIGFTDMCFSPREPNIVAVGSDDCFVRCYDIRMNHLDYMATQQGIRTGRMNRNSHFRSNSDHPIIPRKSIAMYSPLWILDKFDDSIIKENYCHNCKASDTYQRTLNDALNARKGKAGDGISGIDISSSGELLVTYRGADAYRFDMLRSQPASSLSLTRKGDEILPVKYLADVLHVLPDTIYTGHRNVLTFLKEIKYVLGESCVAMGSDTGHVHLWDKLTGKPLSMLRADTSVVNSIAAHKSLPILYTAGINRDIKMWMPRDTIGICDINTPKEVADIGLPFVEYPGFSFSEDEDEYFMDTQDQTSSDGTSDSDYSTDSTDYSPPLSTSRSEFSPSPP